MDPRARLDQKDAQLVVAIHTHGDYFLMSGCGTLQQLGHVDFYVNGGAQQPGCKRGVPEIAVDVAIGALAEDVQNVIGPACSHNRAPPYLIEFLDQALDPNEHCQFRAFPCASTEEWTSGHCFQCPADGCPRLSLNLDYGAFRYGKFYFNTMAEN
uniref:Lipase domain-containing protein n=1 Tax=Romanomermis culicivorax TaxID=13658 RepID=A0A915J6V7_ROMCU